MITVVKWGTCRSVFILIVVMNSSGLCGEQEKNVCPTFDDYYTIKNNANCWFDFTAEFDIATIVEMNGYVFMEYKIQTKDGFILSLFKITSRNRSHSVRTYFPVYLQHGILSTASDFVAVGKNSLAFTLADEGHDVWLGNYRGNIYSQGHVNYTTCDKQFWEHTMDDIVEFDFPVIFDKIKDETPPGGQIIYIGHSLGTTLALMFNAKYPKQSQKLFKLVILLCPAYTLTNMRSPYRFAAPYGQAILNTIQNMGLMRFLSQGSTTKRIMKAVCLACPTLMKLCLRAWNVFYGLGATIGPEMVPVFFHQLPGGTSLKIIRHAADLVLGYFRHYDHGHEKNIRRYCSWEPPIYNISRIGTPIHIVYSTADWATTEKDAQNLYETLPKVARHGIRRISRKNFNHIDFILTRVAKKVVYDDLLKVINNVIPESNTNINATN